MTADTDELRGKVIQALVRDAPAPLGRTAVMKLAYFLQTLFQVPLGYRFTLYTYGPYDGEVLSDLALAEAHGSVKSALTVYPNGNQGYLYSARKKGKAPKLGAHAEAVEKALDEFGARSASDLEMASTIVYVDRSEKAKGRRVPVDQLAAIVHEIKPHLVVPKIDAEARRLLAEGHLLATTA